MKKISLLVAVLVISCLHSFAQTEKGSLYSGPSFSISYYNYSSKGSTNSIKSTSHSLNIEAYLSAGYFVANNLAIGPGLSIGYGWVKYTSGDYYSKYQGPVINLNPFIRFYFGENQKTKVFIQASGGIGHSGTAREYTSWNGNEYIIIQDKPKYLNFLAGAQLGIVYFINKVIGIESSISYEYNHRLNYSDISDMDSKTNNHNLYLGIGFNYYLAKNNKK